MPRAGNFVERRCKKTLQKPAFTEISFAQQNSQSSVAGFLKVHAPPGFPQIVRRQIPPGRLCAALFWLHGQVPGPATITALFQDDHCLQDFSSEPEGMPIIEAWWLKIIIIILLPR